MGRPKYIAVTIDGDMIRLVPTDALPVQHQKGRPYISVARQFKPLGFEAGTKAEGAEAYNIEPKPYGDRGLEFPSPLRK
jgi:hypothetical protein